MEDDKPIGTCRYLAVPAVSYCRLTPIAAQMRTRYADLQSDLRTVASAPAANPWEHAFETEGEILLRKRVEETRTRLHKAAERIIGPADITNMGFARRSSRSLVHVTKISHCLSCVL